MPSDAIFQGTLAQLEANLTVSLVATPNPWPCNYNDELEGVLAYMEQADFSQAPVMRDGAVVGILDRDRLNGGRYVRDNMQELSGTFLVSSRASLRSIVRTLAHEKSRYRLVVGPKGIEGIVTRADLHKLPVRLLAFTLVTHLEALMADAIKSHGHNDTWIAHLERTPDWLPEEIRMLVKSSTGSQAVKALKRRQERNRKLDAAPTLLEETDFPQKWYVAIQLFDLGPDAATELSTIQVALRNSIMHTKEYVRDDLQLDEFDRVLELTEKWIAIFGRLTNSTVTSDSFLRDIAGPFISHEQLVAEYI